MRKLQGCIARGLQAVAAEQEQIKEQVKEVRRVAATLEPGSGNVKQRKERFQRAEQSAGSTRSTAPGHAARTHRRREDANVLS